MILVCRPKVAAVNDSKVFKAGIVSAIALFGLVTRPPGIAPFDQDRAPIALVSAAVLSLFVLYHLLKDGARRHGIVNFFGPPSTDAGPDAG